MPLRQQFVVQLAITEVQWNQRLLIPRAIGCQAGRIDFTVFAAKRAISPGPSMSMAVPAKQIRIRGESRR
jgi:hypothetical protein